MVPSVDIVDDIIGSLDPEDIPVEFILMAKITDFDGNERVLRGADLRDFLQNPFSVAEVRVLLDVKNIRANILDTVSAIFTEVKRKLADG
jgi:hypothetical protein